MLPPNHSYRSIEDWLADFQNEHEVDIFDLSEISQEWFPGYHYVHVHFADQAGGVLGCGQGRSESEAIIKATAECVERTIFYSSCGHGDTTNGWAIHTDPELARAGAIRELIERDVYLLHHLTESQFPQISSDEVRANEAVGALECNLRRVGIALRFGMLLQQDGLYAVICSAFGRSFERPFGAVIGLCCSDNLQHAMTKSALECWTGLMPILCTDDYTLPAIDFANPPPTPESHGVYALGMDGGAELERFFGDSSVDCPQITLPGDFAVTEWRVLPEPFEFFPGTLVRARNPRLQKLFFGVPQREDVNMARIHQFRMDRGLTLSSEWSTSLHFLE